MNLISFFLDYLSLESGPVHSDPVTVAVYSWFTCAYHDEWKIEAGALEAPRRDLLTR